MTTATGETLVRDVHPAEVLMPGGELLKGRVFITHHRMVLWTDHGAGRVEETLNVALEQPCSVPADRGSLFGQLEVKLADGTTAWVNRGHGCGCHSPLAAMQPVVPWR